MFFISSIAKVLSIIAKLMLARKISTIAMSVYSLTLPTLSLLLNIAQLGIPTTVSKLIAKKKYPIFKIMQVSIFILLVIDLLVGVLYLFLVPYIANNYLQNPLVFPTLYGMVFMLPLISSTSLLKGYFIGINQIEKTNFAQISEEISRLAFIIFFIDYINKDSISLLAFFAMFSSIIGEFASLIHLLISLKTKKEIIKKRIKIDNNNNKLIAKSIMGQSVLNTSSKLIGSIIYFFEPIIFTALMLKANVLLDDLTIRYGIINSYVIPLILLPLFFTSGLSTYLLPKLSFYVEKNKYNQAKKSFSFLSLFCFIIGLIFISLISIFPEFFLNALYGKIEGAIYLKKYGLFFILYFFQTPFHIALICFDKEKLLFFESVICNVVKILFFYILIPIFKEEGMIISLIIAIYLSIIIQSIALFDCFRRIKNKSESIVNI